MVIRQPASNGVAKSMPDRSNPVLAAVPSEMSRVRAETGVVVEVERLVGAGCEQVSVRRAFREAANGDMDKEIFASRDGCPQALVEHPVGVWRQSEAVAGIVVAAFGVLVDVGGLNDITFGRFKLVSG